MGEEIMLHQRPAKTALLASSLFYALLLSLFLLPSLQMADSWPKIQVAELILPLLFILILTHKTLLHEIKPMRTTATNLLVYSIIILLSILLNARAGMLRDYFEILKLVKYCILMLFSFLFIDKINFTKTIKWIFAFILLFNFLHYIDFLGFNKHIQIYYGNEIHILGFGLNSLGQPDTKRILGTVGNPNNNAILFLFFVITFFPEKEFTWKDKMFFYLSILGILACQSRTGFIALGVIYGIAAIVLKCNLRTFVIDMATIACLYLFLFLMGNIYLSTLAGNMLKQNSVRSRMETWNMLFEMIKQKPLLGWSPYKEYIDQNKIYPEGEYVFISWKYGALGLIAHLAWLLHTGIQSWRKKTNREAFNLFLFTVVLLITSITNTPLHDQVILSIFAVMTGAFFNATAKTGVL